MKNKNFDVWLAIGLNILHYRKEQGMTQMQLAEKADISRNHIQRIETAACSCTLDTLIDIAEALNIPLKKSRVLSSFYFVKITLFFSL